LAQSFKELHKPGSVTLEITVVSRFKRIDLVTIDGTGEVGKAVTRVITCHADLCQLK
jgi:hypothetical protein